MRRLEDEFNNVVIRKSQLYHWKMCPLLYKYVWVDKLKSEPGVEQQYGTLFHNSAKAFFDALDCEKLEKCTTWKSAMNLFNDTFEPEHVVVGKWLRNFFEFEARHWQFIRERAQAPLKFWMPLATELELLSTRRGFMMHIDRVDRLPNGNIINVDYKTDKYWNQSKLRSELTFYNIGINTSGKFVEPCTHIGCYNPQLHRWFSEECSARSIAAVNRLVLQFRRAILSGTFPPRPQRYCRYCYHNFRCLEAGYFDTDFIA